MLVLCRAGVASGAVLLPVSAALLLVLFLLFDSSLPATSGVCYLLALVRRLNAAGRYGGVVL